MDRLCARRNVVEIARNNPNYHTVVGARLKQSGMRWTVAGGYEDYWAQRAKTPKISK